ncbi:MAG: ATP-binding protein [Odoribacteraceae bacterium]|jgi:DNA transposition AAA+ family ATPase|nr:ATP-binding protein [Odoribacteraceae bacterium]
MKNSEKEQIKGRLAGFCRIKGGQNKAANALRGVSAATISQVLNDNHELISDEMWRTIATQVGHDPRAWVVVETRGYRRVYDLLRDARENSLVFAVTGDAGCGKSEAIKGYAGENRDVYALSCPEYWNRRHFLEELSRCMGIALSGTTVPEMMSEVILALKRKESPLLILDEADKLSDQVLYFFISLYNRLEDHAGIVLCATGFLEKRVKRGVRLGRRGYAEIYSRLGRRFIPVQAVNGEDIAAVCVANGVSDPAAINEIIEDCEGDLRRVKRKVHALKRRSTGQTGGR